MTRTNCPRVLCHPSILFACIMLCVCVSRASTIITVVSDDFNATDGTPVHTRTPDLVNLPLGTWYSVGGGTTQNNPFGAAPDINGNAARTFVNSSAYISLQSAGSYTKPTKFTISADVMAGTTTGNTFGVGLGFNDDKTLFDVTQEISLSITGNVSLKQVLIAPYNPANFSGNAFDPNSFYHLSYSIDTATGGVSNLTLSNSFGSQSYTVSTNVFTDAETAYAGIFSNSANIGTNSKIDNFLVTAEVPEPASIGLVALGAVVTLVRRQRRA